MWKDFFSFTSREQKGILVLLVLITGIAIGKFIFTERKEAREIEFVNAISSTNDSLKLGIVKENIAIAYQDFDPNTADAKTFESLGISQKAINNILRYREKNGKFRKAEDFSKIYGLDSDTFKKLMPYIKINPPKDFIPKQEKSNYRQSESKILSNTSKVNQTPKQLKISSGTTIDINVADTSDLKTIPNIGSGFSKRIVKYREILGGFYSIEQIKEVYGVDETLFLKIAPFLTIAENPKINTISVNKSSLDKLKSHPYINFYQAKAIIELRKKKGRVNDISELDLLEEFSDGDIERMNIYLSFE